MGGRGELDVALDDAVSDRFAIEALHIDTLGDALDIAFRHLVRQVNDHQDHVVILHLGISHEGRIGALEESGRRPICFLASILVEELHGIFAPADPLVGTGHILLNTLGAVLGYALFHAANPHPATNAPAADEPHADSAEGAKEPAP